MNPTEAMMLLIAAKAIDDRVVADKERAQAWSWVLSDVELDEAKVALRQHYRDNGRAIMPNDVLQLARVVRRDKQAQQPQIETPTNVVPMPDDLRQTLNKMRFMRRI